MDAFFLKANCFYAAGPGKLVATTGVGNTYQHTTLGGVNRDTGEDATNPVTYMVLETVGRLKLHDPTISLRFNKNSPDKLWGCAIATSKLVGGLPLYQNDEVIIPGIIKAVSYTHLDVYKRQPISTVHMPVLPNPWAFINPFMPRLIITNTVPMRYIVR